MPHWRHAEAAPSHAALAPCSTYSLEDKEGPAPLPLSLSPTCSSPSSLFSLPFFRIFPNPSELPRPTPFGRRLSPPAVDSGHPEENRRRHQLRLAEPRLPAVGIGLGSPKSSRRRCRPPPGPAADRHDCLRLRPPLPPTCSPTRPR